LEIKGFGLFFSALSPSVVVFIIGLILEYLFFGFCGWLGKVFVKILTLGKIDLDDGDYSESVITEWIGVAVLLVCALMISFLINSENEQSTEVIQPRGESEPLRQICILTS